jgi:RecA/RadA recombinase
MWNRVGAAAFFSGFEARRRLESYPSYTSGSGRIDQLLGGGIKAGRLIMVFGKSNSGKSQLAMQAALCAAKAGARSLYIDTEGAFRPERVEEMARERGWNARLLLESIVYLRCNSAAEQADAVRRMSARTETSSCRLVLIDTLTRNFSLDLPGSENMPDRQGALDVHLSEMARDAFLNCRAYVLMNRVTFDRTGADVGIGGSTVEQLVHGSLHMQREGAMVRVSDTGGRGSCLVAIDKSGIGASEGAVMGLGGGGAPASG